MALTKIQTAGITDGTVGADDLASTLNLSSKTVTLPAASVTAHVTQTDTSVIEYNIALLAFKLASSNSLAQFQMVDQVVDEFVDATGIDASASTNEGLTSGYYRGETVAGGNPTGGTTSEYTSGSTYWVNTFTSSGNYIVPSSGTVDYLVVAGGGSGGSNIGAGAGAGGLLTGTGHSVTAQTYAITVGAGGSGTKDNGDNSVFSSFTAIGGGGGGTYDGSDNNIRSGAVGGSGGGGTGHGGGPGTGAAGTSGQGNAGATGVTGGTYQAGGGGGAGAAASGGTGGSGTNNTIRTGSNIAYGGGGGGGIHPGGAASGAQGGDGGGGAGGGNSIQAVNGTANTGGGGGGAKAGGTVGEGGSGIVVIRTVKDSMQTTSVGDLTLVSTTTTAEATPTTGDIVLLIEDQAGTATINTDVLGYISRNAGSNWSSAVTFVDEGDWGTNKRILVARDVDISSLTGTTSMRYKIATANQSAAKETRIHAVSLAWA
jgi:hypothetical protein